MTNRNILSIGLMVFGLILTACGVAEPTPEPTETIIPPTIEAPTEVAVEPTAVLTTLIAPNPTVVASGITPQEAVIMANVAEAEVMEGERLYTTALIPTCTSCHVEDTSVRQTAPTLLNFSELAGTRVEGEGAYTYAYNSIRYANQHIVEEFSGDVMPVYDGILTDQEVYELIAYIWTLGAE